MSKTFSKTFYFFAVLLFFLLLVSAWLFLPYQTGRFERVSGNTNFSLYEYGKEEMQFYKNMRFPDSRISYKMDNCPLQKANDMERSFEKISEITPLAFYQTNKDEEILITCKERTVIEGNLFIAGEGGPTKIIPGENFNVILNGEILLLRNSDCPEPNVGTHELLHVLGFNHSNNPNNLMYPVSKCGQIIGEDIIELLNQLYSIPSYPDLSISDVEAIMHGRYINLNFSIQNQGLKDSKSNEINIYADNRIIKTLDIKPLEIGQGMVISLTNLGVTQVSFNELKIEINSAYEELDTKNNVALLKIK